MLGWEYPPHISGGLGTACQGLTTSLAALGVGIDFVVPRLYGDEDASHMRLIDSSILVPAEPEPDAPGESDDDDERVARPSAAATSDTPQVRRSVRRRGVRHIELPSPLSPYLTPAGYEEKLEELRPEPSQDEPIENTGQAPLAADSAAHLLPREMAAIFRDVRIERGRGHHYGADLFSEVARYAGAAVHLAESRSFDLVHAHDWMTYPAGIALAREAGVPLIAHVHSLEHDRSGHNVNERINAIERAGLEAANAIVAVSHYTRGLIHDLHRVPTEKVFVVHNGVYPREAVDSFREREHPPGKVVLFLGRVTFQKGPDYFVEAANRVIPHVPGVTFVMAGSGDMLPRMIERVAELGITKNFRFTGFLRGKDVERMYGLADLYVMPSVSEPFGISSLEAMSYDIPVIISRQSGVSEVLSHAMKVDFWDVEQMANLIIGVLKYPELREDIVGMAREEVRRVHWDAAAEKTVRIYHRVRTRAARTAR
jgi:glycosyltransferase involved in cell wall biosynthesis